MQHWHLYKPDSSQPWNLARVVHLHRRIAFGATIAEQQRDLVEGPQAAVTRLLERTARQDTPAAFDELANVIGNAAADSPNPDRLKAWWLYRCLFTPDPLQERLTLMWHNHFATSNLKVGNLYQMKQQNETLRKHARAKFGDMLHAMLRDPALLVWLDAPSNRKGHPNENLARELMELFTLGVGNYTETDVKEVARSLTGWTVRKGRFEDRTDQHDDGEKTILGQTSSFNTKHIVDLLLKQSAVSKRLAWRLTSEFFGEGVVCDEAEAELAALLRDNALNIGETVETMLRSRLFFSDANINSRICDPVSFLIGPLRTLGITSPPPSTLLLADWLRRMGQDLFYPPNVGGWNGGRSWLSTRTVIARTNYAAALVKGQLRSPSQAPQLTDLCAAKADRLTTAEFLATSLGIRSDDFTPTNDSPEDIVVSLMTRPEAHLH